MPFIILTITLFSTIEVAVKLLHGSIDPLLLALFRFLVAGILLALLSLSTLKKITFQDLLRISAIGLIGIAGTFAPFHIALGMTTVGAKEAALLFSLNPIFATLFATLFLKEHLSIRAIGGILLGFVGVYVVIFGLSPLKLEGITGPLLLLSSALTFGFYTVATKKYVQRYGARAVTAITFISGSIVLTPFIKDWSIPFTMSTLLILFYLTFFTTFIGYLSFFHGLKKVPVGIGSSLFYLKPLLATLLAVLILHETLELHYLVGMVLVFIAMTLTLFRKKIR